MISKNVLSLVCILTSVAFQSSWGMINNQSHQDASPSIKEEITNQSADFYFYNKSGEQIANVSYHLSDESTMYLGYLKIYDRTNRGNGLGKKLFTYFVNHIKDTNPAITTITWQALALDPDYLSQENLEKWYKARGGIRMGKHPNGGSKFKLTLKDFKPEIDLSSLAHLDIKEEFSLKGTTTIEIKHGMSPIAKLGYYLRVNNDAYQLGISDMAIQPNYMQSKSAIETQLQQIIIKQIKAKKWLLKLTPTITTNNLLPQFSL